jgi:phosphosulfolactate synthase
MATLNIDHRNSKPRQKGLTCLIDPGLPLGTFTDMIASYSQYIDYVKFGWCTAAITPVIGSKIKTLQEYQIDFWFGGTLFEIFYNKNALPELIAWTKDQGAKFFEVSDGTLPISKANKLKLLTELAKDFTVLSEIGSKDSNKVMSPAHWIENIKDELDAGAWKIIAEGRESGTAGIYRATGEVRMGLVQEIMESALDFNRIIFEAPQKHQQVWFINNLGRDVNLGNIAFADLINLETLRLSLRSDTINSTDAKVLEI